MRPPRSKNRHTMKLETFTDFLSKHAGARKDGAAYIIPSDTEATIFVSLAGETLTVPKVTRVELSDATVVADTTRGERYVLALDDVRAAKIDKSEAARTSRGAGFGK